MAKAKGSQRVWIEASWVGLLEDMFDWRIQKWDSIVIPYKIPWKEKF